MSYCKQRSQRCQVAFPAEGEQKQRANRVPILDVAEALERAAPERTKLHRQGRTVSAHCFVKGEQDEKPSVRLNLSENRWKCFSCNRPYSDNIELVEVVLDLCFQEALQWLQAKFDLPGGMHRYPADPLAQWASKRQLPVDSVRAFGVEAEGRFLLFPMRYGPAQAAVGRQKRRADNEPITSDGRRSICEKDSERALFFPTDWPEPTDDAVCVVSEGEADAISVHSVGIRHSVGTPGTNWNGDVREALEIVFDAFEPWRNRVLIMDGDVPDNDLFERDARLKARVVRVPTYVSPIASERDLNAWLLCDGSAVVHQTILNAPRYTALRHDAIPNILRAVEESSGLQKRHRAVVTALALHLLQNILPFRTRECNRVEVGPGQWLTTLRKLCSATGADQQTVRTVLKKLRDAGVLTWQSMGGRKGMLIAICNVSEFIRLTPKSWELYQEELPSDVPNGQGLRECRRITCRKHGRQN